MALKHVFYLTF